MSPAERYKVMPVSVGEVRPILQRVHYMHSFVTSSHRHGLYLKSNNKLVGVAVYNQSSNMHLAGSIMQSPWDEKVLHLARLCMDEDEKDQPTSWFLSRSMDLLPKPCAVVSFADPGSGHTGKIYQATNWIYTGMSQGKKDKAHILADGSVAHHRTHANMSAESIAKLEFVTIEISPKHRYVKLLGNKSELRVLRRNLKLKSKPYPEGATRRGQVPSFDDALKELEPLFT